MSDKHRKIMVRQSVLALLVLTAVILLLGGLFPEKRGIAKTANTNKALVAKLVNGPTAIVVPTNGETISHSWIKSGAEARGFNLTIYTRAVKKLNPGQNVNVFRDGITWEVPWPKDN